MFRALALLQSKKSSSAANTHIADILGQVGQLNFFGGSFMFSLGLGLGIVLVLGVGLGFGLVFSIYLGLGLGLGVGLGFGFGPFPDLIRYFIGATPPYKVINPIIFAPPPAPTVIWKDCFSLCNESIDICLAH